MSRLPGAPIVRNPMPDIYTVLLLVGILFLLAGGIVVSWDLMTKYGLSFSQIFTGAGPVPQ